MRSDKFIAKDTTIACERAAGGAARERRGEVHKGICGIYMWCI